MTRGREGVETQTSASRIQRCGAVATRSDQRCGPAQPCHDSGSDDARRRDAARHASATAGRRVRNVRFSNGRCTAGQRDSDGSARGILARSSGERADTALQARTRVRVSSSFRSSAAMVLDVTRPLVHAPTLAPACAASDARDSPLEPATQPSCAHQAHQAHTQQPRRGAVASTRCTRTMLRLAPNVHK
jgi:hypothetical protein